MSELQLITMSDVGTKMSDKLFILSPLQVYLGAKVDMHSTGYLVWLWSRIFLALPAIPWSC